MKNQTMRIIKINYLNDTSKLQKVGINRRFDSNRLTINAV